MKRTFIILGVVLFLSACTSDVEKMAKNYEKHHEDISSLTRYMSEVLDDSCGLRMEISRKGKLSMFACHSKEERWLKWHDSDYQEYMPSIGLTQGELDSLIQFLQQSECIGIDIDPQQSEYFSVLYSRPGWLDGYSYLIFKEPISNEMWNSCLDDYCSIPYCDTIVFSYGAPAFGSDDIPKRDKMNFLKKHNIERR